MMSVSETKKYIEDIERLLPTMKAHVAGKKVQVCVDGNWRDVDSPTWLINCKYRIKPREPQVIYCIREKAHPKSVFNYVSKSVADARAWLQGDHPWDYEIVKFIEVMDGEDGELDTLDP